MRKLIAVINMTLDGYCDHTSGIADDELHQHYSDLLKTADALLYGRITFQLMEYWRTVPKNPTGNKATDEFAATIDKVPKIVFSRTLEDVEWGSARVAKRSIEEEARELKQLPGKDIFAGSPSIIVALHKASLLDEYQLCVHPIIAGTGLPLFKNIEFQTILKLVKTKSFKSGAITLYYEPSGKSPTIN